MGTEKKLKKGIGRSQAREHRARISDIHVARVPHRRCRGTSLPTCTIFIAPEKTRERSSNFRWMSFNIPGAYFVAEVYIFSGVE